MADIKVGDRFGQWTVTQLVPADFPARAMVRCDRGRTGILQLGNLRLARRCSQCVVEERAKRLREQTRARKAEAAE